MELLEWLPSFATSRNYWKLWTSLIVLSVWNNSASLRYHILNPSCGTWMDGNQIFFSNLPKASSIETHIQYKGKNGEKQATHFHIIDERLSLIGQDENQYPWKCCLSLNIHILQIVLDWWPRFGPEFPLQKQGRY